MMDVIIVFMNEVEKFALISACVFSGVMIVNYEMNRKHRIYIVLIDYLKIMTIIFCYRPT